jgi:hypothetical protein
MKRLVLALCLLLLPALAFGQASRENFGSTRAIRQFGQALTENSLFGVPRYTTALLPTCDTLGKGAVAFDTTLGSLTVCDGSAWAAAGGSGLTIGTTTITSGTNTRVLYNDSGVVGEDAGFTFIEGTDTIVALGNLELGHATQNTIACASGRCTVEGLVIPLGGAQQITFAGPTQARTYTFPDADRTIFTTAGGTLTAALTLGNVDNGVLDNGNFGFGNVTDFQFQYDTTNTPDTMKAGTSTESESFWFSQKADLNADVGNGPCGTSACTNPTIGGFSADVADDLKWWAAWHDQANAHMATGTGGFLGLAYAVQAVTTTETPAATADQTDETRTLYTNTGDGDGATITLPNDPRAGTHFVISVTVAQTLTIAPSSGETLYLGNDQCVASINSANIGASLQVHATSGGSGAQWHTIASAGWTCSD